MKRIIILVVILLLISLTLTACVSTNIENPLRLHVIANSNSAQDQEVKLKVRDAILMYTAPAAQSFNSAEDVKTFVVQNSEGLKKEAQNVLREEGFDYDAELYLGNYYFPEKVYGDVVYEAGMYDAVRVVLGDGEGRNWWCVIFPPLCLITDDGEYTVDTAEKGYNNEIEFKSLFASLFEN